LPLSDFNFVLKRGQKKKQKSISLLMDFRCILKNILKVFVIEATSKIGVIEGKWHLLCHYYSEKIYKIS